MEQISFEQYQADLVETLRTNKEARNKLKGEVFQVRRIESRTIDYDAKYLQVGQVEKLPYVRLYDEEFMTKREELLTQFRSLCYYERSAIRKAVTE